MSAASRRDDPKGSGARLIEAVRYYAALDAELYPEAARTSPEFAKYKAITPGQCMPGGREDRSRRGRTSTRGTH